MQSKIPARRVSRGDEERSKKSKRTRKKYLKLKEKLQHYELNARDMSVSQTYAERVNSFSSPEPVWYRNSYQRSPSFSSTTYDFNAPATQVRPVAYNSNPYFQGNQNPPFVYMQRPLTQTPFGNPGERGTQPPQNEHSESYFQGLNLLSSAVTIESDKTTKE